MGGRGRGRGLMTHIWIIATWPEVIRRSVEYYEGAYHRHQGLRTPILAASVRSCHAINE